MKRQLFVVAALIVLIACGKGAGAGDPASLVARAASTSEGKGTVRMSGTMTGTVQGRDINVKTTGVVSFVQHRARIVASFTQGSLGTLSEEFISTKDGAFIKFPRAVAASILPQGKTWAKFTLPASGESELFTGVSSNPSAYLDTLKEISSGVTVRGTERIRGVQTTHYVAQIDPDRLIAKMPADVRAKITADAKAFLPKLLNVWIDGEDLVRRTAFDVSGNKFGSLRFTNELYDYGAAVTINVPPAREVADLSSQQRSSGSGSVTFGCSASTYGDKTSQSCSSSP